MGIWMPQNGSALLSPYATDDSNALRDAGDAIRKSASSTALLCQLSYFALDSLERVR